MEQPVQALAGVGEEVEELSGVLRGPHHAGGRLDAGPQPLGDSFVGPDKCLGSLGGFEFDVRGCVEDDQAACHGDVQGSAERRPDVVLRRDSRDAPERVHRVDGLFQRLAAAPVLNSLPGDELQLVQRGAAQNVRVVDLDVRLGDAGEHLVEVRHGEPVEPDVPDPRYEVYADIGVVPVLAAGAQPLLSGEPLFEPLADGDVLSE
ncbi:hypothetical protein [Streptomyces sp. NPDC094437]|uniref:hypothetical protein n=1 Tax=Streptomyces sp. NPDC094437 TaxID=3366060 RepID=UPI0037F92504